MTSVTDVREPASTLAREGRAVWVAQSSVADLSDQARLAALRKAVDAAEASIAAGLFDRVPADGLRAYIRRLGDSAVADVSGSDA